MSFTSFLRQHSLRVWLNKQRAFFFGFRPGKINRIRVDSNYCTTELCEIGGRMHTDKSPLNAYAPGFVQYRHAYTPVYDFLFSPLRYREINVAEIGIFKGSGLRTFREYFPNANLYGFELKEQHRALNQSFKLKKTDILSINVKRDNEITQAFEKTGVQFDIILDDATHKVDDQTRVIKCCTPFLKSGGILIIEDIYDDERADECLFEEALSSLGDQYCYSSFIYTKNKKTDIGTWNNEKLLVLVKR